MSYGITFGDGRQNVAHTGFDYPTALDAMVDAYRVIAGEVAVDCTGRFSGRVQVAELAESPYEMITEAWIDRPLEVNDENVAYMRRRDGAV